MELKLKKIDTYLSDYKYKKSYFIFDKAWISAAIVLGISQLLDIQYYDLRISLAMWIILGGLRAYINVINYIKKRSIINNSLFD